MPKIQLQMTPAQAGAACDAFDAYTRLCIGQLDEIANLVRQGVIPMACMAAAGGRVMAPAEICDQVGDLMDEAKRVLGYHRNGSHGIGHPHVILAGRRAYELEKVLAKVAAEERNPNPVFRGVNYDGLGPRYTTDPAPVASLVVPAGDSAGWLNVKDALPEIPADDTCSVDVLAGFWYEDSWLKESLKWQFSQGVCRMLKVNPSREFPQGKQWHTYGPAHSQITHWRPLNVPPARPIE